MGYFRRVAVAVDQLINVITGGSVDETISSRMGRKPDCGFCAFVCRILDKLDPKHCAKAVESERMRRDLPRELRE